MAEVDDELIDAVRSTLAAVADPARAAGMQAYMKSAMPFRGVPRPALRAALRPVLAAHPSTSFEGLVETARALYLPAEFREERYAALELIRHRSARPFRTAALLPLLEELAVAGAWWDLVDEIGGHIIADLHRRFPAELRPRLLQLSHGDDLWLRRISIICQLGSKAATDTDLLRLTIDANLAERDFFLRKAIGWALRDYARTDPAWVRRFVDERGEALSSLSRREATKHMP